MSTDKPYFSICIPVYNGEKFIAKAIESVLRQTFQDWALVVIDDSSTDHTWELLQEYKDHPKIKLFKNDSNLGMRGNLNRCIELAQGQWLGILPADDSYNPHALETIYSQTHNRPELVMWMHAHLCFGDQMTANVPLPFSEAKEFSGIGLAELLYMKGNIFGELSSFFININSYKNKPDCLFTDGTQSVDQRFWIRVLMANQAGKAIFWPEVLTRVLIHSESGSSLYKGNKERLSDFFDFPADFAALGWRKKILILQILRILKCGIKLYPDMPPGEKFKAFRTIGVLIRHLLK